MAQQFLDRAEIAAPRQQMRREGMPEGMRRGRIRQPMAPRRPSIASWMIRGDRGPPLAPTKSGPSGPTFHGHCAR